MKSVRIARKIDRPNTREFIDKLFENFMEMHGDRLFADDGSIVGGIASFEGIPVTVIGIQKGHTLDENVECNFGSPNPEGYRKALRLMKQAEKFHRPVITLVNTAGAFCGIGAEERGQGEAIARNIMGYRNRVRESRKAVASQMKEISDAVKNMLDSMPKMQRLSNELEEVFQKEFRKKRVICKNIYAYEKQDGQIEIIMNARTTKGRLVTATELSRIMSRIMQKKLKPSDASRKVIDTEFGEYIFVEETKYKAITGVARMTKDEQDVSGDTFSMINLQSGELLMALSDGMGSGTSALDESKNVIELLEQMSEAGFSQTSAIRLINSLYMSDQEFESYATLDISLINLYKGECSFLKNGAVGTYILNQGKMYCIEGQSLPMGVIGEAEPYIGKMNIYSGDYIIMMTDGVADMFSDEKYNLEKYIGQIDAVNPGDMAQAIVDEAVRRNSGYISDDMSVIVAGVWEN